MIKQETFGYAETMCTVDKRSSYGREMSSEGRWHFRNCRAYALQKAFMQSLFADILVWRGVQD